MQAVTSDHPISRALTITEGIIELFGLSDEVNICYLLQAWNQTHRVGLRREQLAFVVRLVMSDHRQLETRELQRLAADCVTYASTLIDARRDAQRRAAARRLDAASAAALDRAVQDVWAGIREVHDAA